jgi:hypothetical protein
VRLEQLRVAEDLMARRLDCVYVWHCFQALSKEAQPSSVQAEVQPCSVLVPPPTSPIVDMPGFSTRTTLVFASIPTKG